MSPVLYQSAVSGNCYKVRLLAAHLGVGLELRELDVVDRSDRSRVLGDLSPSLRVPALVLEDGRPLAESGAILWFLGESSRFVPDDAYARAQVLQWMFFEQYEHEPAIAVARFLVAYSRLPRAEYEQRLPRLWADGEKALGVMERHLSARDWFVGEAMTLADVVLFAYTHVAEEGEFDLAPFPRVRGWLDRVAAEPGHLPMGA